MTTAATPPRILITNDDGIDAPGIVLLESIAREFSDDIWVVAPDNERSGAGHSISITTPIRTRQLDSRRWEIVGTPSDCVLMALWQFMSDRRPDVILSGINGGANLAEDLTYSGTIAAAMEGALLGIRSIALSQVREPKGVPNFAPAEAHARDILEKLLALGEWPAGSFINVNFPDCPLDEIGGARVTGIGQRPAGAFSIDARIDARGKDYYWVAISYPDGTPAEGTDLAAIADKAIAVTPLKMDFTDHAWRRQLADTLA